jgi:ligand-binding sensor domain-containing protein/signal transduction histidine kinase
MVSQYIHDSWEPEKGFPGSSVSSIAQTPDGYLWIGTDKGLVRFDGLNFRRFDRANPGAFLLGPVRSLLADPQGNLWILLENTKLFRYHDGTFDLSRGEAENGITAMGRGTEGTILLSSLAMGTLTYNGKRFLVSSAPVFADSAGSAHVETPDERSAHLSWSSGVMPHRLAAPTSAVISIAATTDGRIWLGTQDRGLFYLKNGRVSAVENGPTDMKVNCLLPLSNSELWIGTSKGILRWNGTELTRAGVPSSLLHLDVLSMILDRDANIWLGTSRGVLRLNDKGVSSLARENAVGGGPVTALFEDREGNIWIGGARGLERLRDSAFVTYSVAGLQSQSMGALYVGADDQTWVAPIEGGLRWLKREKSSSVTAAGLTHDIVYSITGNGKNELWIGRQRGGLTNLRNVDGSLTAETYTQADGLAQNSVYAVYQSRDGAVWSGTLSAGISELRNGRFTNYTTINGLVSNTVSSIAEGAEGTMWFGTPKGLSELSKNGWRTFRVGDGLPSEDVNCLLLDSTGVLWIGTADGLAFLRAGHVHVFPRVPDLLHEPILGIAEDNSGWLWIAAAGHVLQVNRTSLVDDVLSDTDLREYGSVDGLRGTEGVKRFQSVVKDSRGRIWFSTNRGISVVNPARATVNPIPSLAHIEAVLADGIPFDIRGPIRVSARHQKTAFRFAGLSLSNSERVRYRYRLDGLDKGWSEPVATREASYSNLAPGSYRFRVMASNSDGLWNGSEAAVGFEVEPTLWQTRWFRLALVFCVGLATLAVYRLRMHRLTRLLRVRFEERLAERTRIAQELHDTLLQGVLSASMQLDVALDQLPEGSAPRLALDRVLQLLRQVVDEGRNTLRGLRSSIESTNDLKSSFLRVPQELGGQEGTDFRVVVQGASTPLRSAIRDDVYSIGREALVNAFRHSQAASIEVQLEYAPDQLRIFVRDDGRGIDPQVLESGRDGHWGLSGMRERAERIGARLKVFSRLGAGTEVELRVPSDIAFESQPSSLASKWFAMLRWPQKEVVPPAKRRAG